MYCEKCGAELSDKALMCIKCGEPTSNYKFAATTVKVVKEEPEGNGMAIAGFVCSFLSPLLGWIFGGIGLSRAIRRNGKRKGLAISALVIASVNFILGFILLK